MARDDLENLVLSECGEVFWTREESGWTAADVIEECEIELEDGDTFVSTPVFLHDYDGDYFEECQENERGAFRALRWEIK